MKKLNSILLIFFLSISYLFAQKLKYESIKFSENPSLHALNDTTLEKESAVIIQDNRYIQIYNSISESATYSTYHKIAKVNDDAGIEKLNKLYIHVSKSYKLVDIQIRTIDNNGVVNNFNKDNLKEIKNLEGYGNFIVYAIEGLVKGGELEYLYTIKYDVLAFARQTFQSDIFIKEANFELSFPKGFNYITKSYNGFPQSDSISLSRKIHATNIPALTKQGLSDYKFKQMRVDFRLERDFEDTKSHTWLSFSKQLFYSLVYNEDLGQEESFLRKLNLKDKSDYEKVRIIEKEFKENFSMISGNNPDNYNLFNVFKNLNGNETGIVKAYIKCFENLKLKFFIVYSNSRYNEEIDPDFPHYMDFDYITFYFPELNVYVNPLNLESRIGNPDKLIAGNLGFFLVSNYNSKYEFRKLNFVGYKFNKIRFLKSSENVNKLDAIVNFNQNLDSVNIEQTNSYQVYNASELRYKFNKTEENEKKTFVNENIITAIGDANIMNFKFENENLDCSSDNNKLFKFNINYGSKSLIQNSNGDFIFSIGKIIGKQNELDFEVNRQTDVVLSEAKQLKRKIIVNIPNGYICKGLEQLKIDNFVSVNNLVKMQFVSDYKIENNQLIVTISENYDILELDKSYYENYRKVINSAADFSKISILFVKK